MPAPSDRYPHVSKPPARDVEWEGFHRAAPFVFARPVVVARSWFDARELVGKELGATAQEVDAAAVEG